MDSIQHDIAIIARTIKKQVPVHHPSSLKTNLYLKDHLIQKYSTSQSFYYIKLITDVLSKKQGQPEAIKTNDVKFDDGNEHFQKYYHKQQSSQELPELFEYYKYYTQESLCFLNREFSFLAVHHERKKAALYFQLKKQLNISDSQELSQVTKPVQKKCEFGNVLSGLNLSISKSYDESYFVNETLTKLNKVFGATTIKKPLSQIDSEFKFMAHPSKPKNTKVSSFFNHKSKILESTNTSYRNTNNKSNSKKKPSHKRYISCELTGIYAQPIPNKKGKNLKRRKSADFIENPIQQRLNTKNEQVSIQASSGKCAKKNEKAIKNESTQMMFNKKKKVSPLIQLKTNTTYLTQATVQKQKEQEVKNTIENLRYQIRKQKENMQTTGIGYNGLKKGGHLGYKKKCKK